jgi:DNA (cytosine-5)-methyltransferase 1
MRRDSIWIRAHREELHLSQARLSKLTGLSQALLSGYELEKIELLDSHEELIRRVFFNLRAELSGSSAKTLFKKSTWSRDFLQPSVRRGSIKQNDVEQFVGRLNARVAEVSCGLSAISLFAGCGGMTKGFADAGYSIKGYAELSSSAREMFSANFPNASLLGTDVREITEHAAHDWRSRFGEIDVMFGGPPCQGFSLSGKRDRWDPRNQLYKEFARLVGVVQPRAFVLENVRLLTSMKSPSGESVPDLIIEEFGKHGYNTVIASLNAQDFGVPQFRERVFFLGIKAPATVNFPQPTHSEFGPTIFDNLARRRQTFRDAVADLEVLESGEASGIDPLHFAVSHPTHVLSMLRDVPQGKSAHEHPDPSLRPKSGYNTTYKRLLWDEPCSTVGTTFGMISGSRNVHPASTRSLTIREAARCQSFPDTYQFFGNLGDIRTAIGNAVPPRLAKEIAAHLTIALCASVKRSAC